MESENISHIIVRKNLERDMVLRTSDRGQSSYVLASMAMENISSSAYAAASLLLAMEDQRFFEFKNLLAFDSVNRAHADLVILGYSALDVHPSKWMDDAGYNGKEVMDALRYIWTPVGVG